MINSTSITDFYLSVGGINLLAGEDPASGSITFGLPFTGSISDFGTVTGNLNFLSGTSFSLSDNGVVSGTNAAVFGNNVIEGRLTQQKSVSEPGLVPGLVLFTSLSALMAKKKISALRSA